MIGALIIIPGLAEQAGQVLPRPRSRSLLACLGLFPSLLVLASSPFPLRGATGFRLAIRRWVFRFDGEESVQATLLLRRETQLELVGSFPDAILSVIRLTTSEQVWTGKSQDR